MYRPLRPRALFFCTTLVGVLADHPPFRSCRVLNIRVQSDNKRWRSHTVVPTTTGRLQGPGFRKARSTETLTATGDGLPVLR